MYGEEVPDRQVVVRLFIVDEKRLFQKTEIERPTVDLPMKT